MNHDLEIIRITEKIQERCGCFDCEDGAIMQGYVEKFLNVLARLFCWVDEECGTLLKAPRKEILPIDEIQLCGCEAMVEVKPFYHKGFDPSTLKVIVQKRVGFEREEYQLCREKYNYSFIDGTILINLTEELSPCCRCVCPCSCEAEYKIVLLYEAGYTACTIPDCVYDSLCHFMNIFIAYQNKCGTLEECANMDRLAVGSVLKQKSVDYIVREWTIDNESIDRFYVRLINRWSIATLSSLSLCKGRTTEGMYIAIGRRSKCK